MKRRTPRVYRERPPRKPDARARLQTGPPLRSVAPWLAFSWPLVCPDGKQARRARLAPLNAAAPAAWRTRPGCSPALRGGLTGLADHAHTTKKRLPALIFGLHLPGPLR